MSDGILDKEFYILSILYQSRYAWDTVWNKVFKRDLIKKYSFPKGKQLEDYVVITRMFGRAQEIYFCNRPFYHYSCKSGTQSKRGFYEGKLSTIESAEAIKE